MTDVGFSKLLYIYIYIYILTPTVLSTATDSFELRSVERFILVKTLSSTYLGDYSIGCKEAFILNDVIYFERWILYLNNAMVLTNKSKTTIVT